MFFVVFRHCRIVVKKKKTYNASFSLRQLKTGLISSKGGLYVLPQTTLKPCVKKYLVDRSTALKKYDEKSLILNKTMYLVMYIVFSELYSSLQIALHKTID